MQTDRKRKVYLTLLVAAITVGTATDALAQSTEEPSFAVQIGRADSLYSNILQEWRNVWIQMPNSAGFDEHQKYPVLYVLDGSVHTGTAGVLHEYYAPGKIPEMIIVGISNQTNRTRDLTPSEVTTRNGMNIAQSGGAQEFTAFIREELIPWVDNSHPTSRYRTLVGHSYAGLFAVNTFVHNRDLFDNYVVIDPSLDWDDQKLLRAAKAQRQMVGEFDRKGLFVALSNEIPRFSETVTIDDVMQDTTVFSLSMRSILEFVDVAESWKSSGLKFSWKYYESDLHWSVPFPALRDGLHFIFDWWELRSPSRYNIPETPTEDLVELIRARSERLTRNLGYATAMEEPLLDMLGYMSLGNDQPDKARAVFELAAEYYPESAEAQDSLAEFFAGQRDTAQAIIHARKALELSGSNERRQKLESLLGEQQEGKQ
ncbi:MAG: esterase [Rhodothermales bacterium]|nr:esterase [Rhodothermales bacterium]